MGRLQYEPTWQTTIFMRNCELLEDEKTYYIGAGGRNEREYLSIHF